MFRWLHVAVFKLCGWKVEGSFPADIKKFVIAIAPHTSNWDFTVGLSARSILRLQNARFIGKSQLFNWPYGWFFRWLGGIPVDRSRSHNLVQQAAQYFHQNAAFVLALAPEGTRKKVHTLKTGFYYIAKTAGVPIFPVGFDFARKTVVVGEPLFPGPDTEADLQRLMAFYRGITGKNPACGLS